MRQLLELCTKEAPFMYPNGKLYKQIEGVAMGSPLGPTFTNFYMGNLENIILSNDQKPYTYARYVDDIFIEITSEEELIKLREKFEENSILKFTYEMNINNKLSFLDVMLKNENGKNCNNRIS